MPNRLYGFKVRHRLSHDMKDFSGHINVLLELKKAELRITQPRSADRTMVDLVTDAFEWSFVG